MSRRHSAEKREVLPDPKFGDIVLSRFMNVLMYDGKKSTAEGIVYAAMDTLKRRAGAKRINEVAPRCGARRYPLRHRSKVRQHMRAKAQRCPGSHQCKYKSMNDYLESRRQGAAAQNTKRQDLPTMNNINRRQPKPVTLVSWKIPSKAIAVIPTQKAMNTHIKKYS